MGKSLLLVLEQGHWAAVAFLMLASCSASEREPKSEALPEKYKSAAPLTPEVLQAPSPRGMPVKEAAIRRPSTSTATGRLDQLGVSPKI